MTKRNKILFVHFFNNFSGSPKVLENVINVLKKNHECLLITNNTEGFLDNVSLEKINFRFELSNSKVVTLINYFKAQFSIFFLVLKNFNKGDILYVNTTIPMFAAFAAKLKGGAIVFHLHEGRSSLNFVHKTLSSFRTFCCNHEIFVSKYLKDIEHLKGKNYDILPNVLSEEFVNLSVNATSSSSKDGDFNVLMICSLKKYKGILEFIDICNKLLIYKKIKFNLLLGDDDKAIQEYFKDMEIPENLSLFSKTHETGPHYERASLLLNLSRPDEWVETFGLTILEGMTYGLPCIVPPAGGPIELVIHDVNGYNISCYETKKISELILELSNNEVLYNQMSLNSKKLSRKYTFADFEVKLNHIINNMH